MPDSAGGWRPRRPGDEGDPNIPVVGFTKTYTPFDVDPQHAKSGSIESPATAETACCLASVVHWALIDSRLLWSTTNRVECFTEVHDDHCSEYETRLSNQTNRPVPRQIPRERGALHAVKSPGHF